MVSFFRISPFVLTLINYTIYHMDSTICNLS